MVPGYASPIGAKGALVVVDELVASSANLVAGANKEGYHFKNVNIPRDFTPDHVVDLASAKTGDGCASCGAPVRLEKGIEVGNIFKLGTRYTAALGAEYLDEAGVKRPIIMGSYGILALRHRPPRWRLRQRALDSSCWLTIVRSRLA